MSALERIVPEYQTLETSRRRVVLKRGATRYASRPAQAWIEGFAIFVTVAVVLNLQAAIEYTKSHEFRRQLLELERATLSLERCFSPRKRRNARARETQRVLLSCKARDRERERERRRGNTKPPPKRTSLLSSREQDRRVSIPRAPSGEALFELEWLEPG